MENTKFWKPIIFSFVATPLCLFIAMIFAGAGHGNYFLVKLLFPYTMLSTLSFESITIPSLILAIAQIPLYGLFLGLANEKNKLALMAGLITVVHSLAVITCFLFVNEHFS